MTNLFRYIGIRHLQTKPLRTFLTTFGVALGIALYIGIQIINQSTLISFKENVDAVAGKASLTVSGGETGFKEEKLEVIAHFEGVKHAVPMIENYGYFKQNPTQSPIKNNNNAQTLVILGVDLLKEQSVRTYKTTDEEMIDDPLVFLNQPDSIIVTHQFAQEHHFQVGNTFLLSTTEGEKKFVIRGLLSPVGPAKAFGGSIAIMDIDGARATFGKVGKLDRVDLVLREGEDPEKLAEKLRQKLGPGYQVERPESQSFAMERMVKSYQSILTFFSTLALLVGLFLVSNSVSIAVAERKREIGTLRALGATRKGILFLFLSEACVMGALGAFIGAWIGRGIAAVLLKYVVRSMSSQYLTHIQVSHLIFGANDVIRAVLIGMTASILAAAWPSYKATQIQPLEAMKRNYWGENANQKGWYRYAPFLGMTMLFFATLTPLLGWTQGRAWMDTLNEAFSILGATLIGPALVGFLIRLFRPLAIRLGGTVTRLAQDNLVRNPVRTGSNVMSLMVGLMLVVLISIINWSFKTTILNWFEKVLHSDLIVSSAGKLIQYQVQPLEEKLGREIEKIPGIKMSSEKGVYGLRFLHLQYEGRKIAMRAYDEPSPEIHYSNLNLLDRSAEEAGYELYHSQEPVALISENFALHFHKKRGESIILETPSGAVSFKVIGVLVDFASDAGVVHISRELYKKLWNDSLVNAFALEVAPGYDAQKVRDDIDRRFGESKGLMVTSNIELRQQMTEVIDQGFADSKAIEAAALLVGLLGLLNTLFISVMERMQEIGMLRAVGMSRRQVASLILQEALFQGGFGAFSAVLIGSWISYIWITYGFSHVLGWVIQFHFPWSSIIFTVLIGLVVALLAAYLPARKAAKMEITEALDYE